MKKTTMFRKLMDKEGIIAAPLAYDCMSAMVAEKAGFKTVFMSGLAMTAAVMGLPDIGLEDRTLTVKQGRDMAASVDIPVWIDAGTAYGGPLGAYLTVRQLIRAGVAGCFIEDQPSPSLCPNIGDPKVIPMDDFVLAIGAMLQARKDEHDEDFVLIARTDAAATLGIDEAIKRGRAYRKAGADAILAVAGGPKDKEGLRRFIKAVDAPVMTPNRVPGLTVKDYEQLGVKLLTIGGLLHVSVKAMMDCCREVLNTGDYKGPAAPGPEVDNILKMDEWSKLGKKYKVYPS